MKITPKKILGVAFLYTLLYAFTLFLGFTITSEINFSLALKVTGFLGLVGVGLVVFGLVVTVGVKFLEWCFDGK